MLDFELKYPVANKTRVRRRYGCSSSNAATGPKGTILKETHSVYRIQWDTGPISELVHGAILAEDAPTIYGGDPPDFEHGHIVQTWSFTDEFCTTWNIIATFNGLTDIEGDGGYFNRLWKVQIQTHESSPEQYTIGFITQTPYRSDFDPKQIVRDIHTHIMRLYDVVFSTSK